MTHQKIAFLCSPYHRGGVTTWMMEAAIAASRSGCEVFFITVDPVKPFHSGKDREKMTSLLNERGKNIRLISAPVNFTFEFGTDDARAAVYRNLVRENVPQQVPLIVSDDTAVWRAAGALADTYLMIGVLHGNNDNYYGKAIKYQEQLSICVCVSNRIRQTAALKCAEIDPSILYTIPCGIDLPVLGPSHIEDGIHRLIFIGRLTDQEKRSEDLIKIGALLRGQGIKFHLDLVGNSESTAPEFAALCKNNGIDGSVSFHGWRSKEEIQLLLNKSDLLLLTSNSEGMPLVMMEALASGCGFTGTRVSGIEDYEHHPLAADCVSVYTVGDIEDAVNKIKKIALIPPAMRTQAARHLAEAEFSMAICLEKYMRAIAGIKPSVKPIQEIRSSPVNLLYSKAIALARYIKVSIMS